MATYLIIESRDPFASSDIEFCYDLAKRLAHRGNEVTLFLVQNGVLPARAGARSISSLSEVAAAGVRVLADGFSLNERGITPDRLASGVAPAPLDVVLDALGDGAKTMWH